MENKPRPASNSSIPTGTGPATTYLPELTSNTSATSTNIKPASSSVPQPTADGIAAKKSSNISAVKQTPKPPAFVDPEAFKSWIGDHPTSSTFGDRGKSETLVGGTERKEEAWKRQFTVVGATPVPIEKKILVGDMHASTSGQMDVSEGFVKYDVPPRQQAEEMEKSASPTIQQQHTYQRKAAAAVRQKGSAPRKMEGTGA